MIGHMAEASSDGASCECGWSFKSSRKSSLERANENIIAMKKHKNEVMKKHKNEVMKKHKNEVNMAQQNPIWEYAMLGLHPELYIDIIEALNKAGGEGWELVFVQGNVAYFKRRKIPSAKPMIGSVSTVGWASCGICEWKEKFDDIKLAKDALDKHQLEKHPTKERKDNGE